MVPSTATSVARAGAPRLASVHPVPALPAHAIDRSRLMSVLDPAARGQRLSLVVAPPGYGKTVLLTQLASLRSGERLRWLACSPTHNTAHGLARALCEVFDSSARKLTTRLLPLASSGDPSMGDRFLAALLDELDMMPPTTLVIDDLHLVTRPSLLADLAALVDRAPRTLHVVVGTQFDPPSDYYRAATSDLLIELRKEDLAFTVDEAATLLELLADVALSRAQVTALVDKTEGWGAGLQLAAVALRGEADVDRFIERFAEDPRHVADYLTEHVLDRQPAAIRRFLVATSVLEGMNGALCDAITGEEGGTAVLEHLDHSSLFVTRTGAMRSWYRYHPLFRALLRSHLHAAEPVRERALLRRAAGWHLAHDDVEHAVAYLLEAGVWDDVVDIALSHAPSLLRAARTSMLVDWLRRVPTDLIAGRDDVAVLRAGAMVFGGEPAQAHELVALLDGVAPTSRPHRLAADLLHGYWSVIQGDPTAAIAHAQRALDTMDGLGVEPLVDVLGLTSTRHDVVVAANGVRGFAHLQLGELSEARRWLAESAEGAHPLWEAAVLGTRAVVEAWSGRLDAAEQLARQVLGAASEVGLHQPVTKAHLALAVVLAERGEPAGAAALLDEAEATLDPRRQRVSAALVEVQRAALALADGTPSAGLALFAAHRPHEDPTMPPWVVVRRCVVEAGLQLALGDLDEAERALAVAPHIADADLCATRVRVAVARGDLAGAGALLDAWTDDCSPRGRSLRALWTAVLAHRAGDDEQAGALLADVVAAAEVERDIGLLWGGGGPVLDLVRAAYLRAPTSFLRSVVERPVADDLAPRQVQGLVEQITDREYAVLAVLSTRLSNAEIADRFGISLNTVKTHLKHIYRKLEVDGRSEAVAAAERLGLL